MQHALRLASFSKSALTEVSLGFIEVAGKYLDAQLLLTVQSVMLLAYAPACSANLYKQNLLLSSPVLCSALQVAVLCRVWRTCMH